MQITEKNLTNDELKYIYNDFTSIEIALGIPQKERVRYSYAAKENGNVIAYASGITNHKWFLLSDMWVQPSHRRRGIGTRLLHELENKIMSVGIEHVYTWMMNMVLDNENDYVWTIGYGNEFFYEKTGYRPYTVIENFFDVDGIHHVGYRKDLLPKQNNTTVGGNNRIQFTDNEITQDELDAIAEAKKRERQTVFLERIQTKYSYVAENNGEVIGYVAGFTNYKWFMLTDMWVSSKYRRRGLGSKLLLMLEEKAKLAGAQHVYTWTYGKDNAQYYENRGYTSFAVFEEYFEVDGIHNIGYRKDI